MRFVSFTMAAVSLLVATASLIRQHAIAQDLLQLAHRVANTPPDTRVIRIEAPPPLPPIAVATPEPPRAPRKTATPRHTAQLVLSNCGNDPICGIPEKKR